jgi:hypothetical protein
LVRLSRSLGLAVLTVIVGVPRSAPAQSESAETTELAALVAGYDSAWNRRDTVAVSRRLAPRYQYFTSRGEVSSRSETMTFLAAPDYVLEDAKRSELAITLSGPVAVVSSRWQGRGIYRGEPFIDNQRCGQVWQQTARGWQLLSEHCVQITSQPPAPSN